MPKEQKEPNVGTAEYPNQNDEPTVSEQHGPIELSDLIAHCQIYDSCHCEESLWAHFAK